MPPAEVAALGKERSWAAQAEAQDETFYPLAIEAGGAVHERFREDLVTLASLSPPSGYAVTPNNSLRDL